MAYFTYYANEDGGHLEQYEDKAVLLRRLNSDLEEGIERVFLGPGKALPDSDYWPDNTILVIEGEIVVPKPKKVVESLDI